MSLIRRPGRIGEQLANFINVGRSFDWWMLCCQCCVLCLASLIKGPKSHELRLSVSEMTRKRPQPPDLHVWQHQTNPPSPPPTFPHFSLVFTFPPSILEKFEIFIANLVVLFHRKSNLHKIVVDGTNPQSSKIFLIYFSHFLKLFHLLKIWLCYSEIKQFFT